MTFQFTDQQHRGIDLADEECRRAGIPTYSGVLGALVRLTTSLRDSASPAAVEAAMKKAHNVVEELRNDSAPRPRTGSTLR